MSIGTLPRCTQGYRQPLSATRPMDPLLCRGRVTWTHGRRVCCSTTVKAAGSAISKMQTLVGGTHLYVDTID